MTIAEAAAAFTIGRSETHIHMAVDVARDHFRSAGSLLVRPGVTDNLLVALDTIGRRAHFVDQPVPDVGHRRVDRSELAATAMKIAICRPHFLRWVEAVTGCGPVAEMAGWVAETRPGSIDQLGWHRDTAANYAVAFTVHLGSEDYDGGLFEIREFATRRMRFRHDRAQRGDVLLFDIDAALEHRVTAVTGGAARRVFTGWLLKA